MFEIEYKGANAVVFTTKKLRVVFDPNVEVAGGKNVPVGNDVEALTEDRFAVVDSTPRLIFNGPGEYEVGDVSLLGIPACRHIDAGSDVKKSTIYKITVGDVRGVVIGNIGEKLTDEQLEEISVVDFAILPVGGNGYTLDATGAGMIARQLDAKVVIPIHYDDPQAGLDEFVKAMSAPVVEAGQKWKLKKSADLPENLTIVQVSRS
mgnify:CR=1 FL=1